MPTPSPIIIIADDLSGAAELAGIAFQNGLSAVVHHVFSDTTDPQPVQLLANFSESPADVIAIDTDSRNLPSATAAARVHTVAKHLLAIHPAWIFKKVDSVLRGNVRSEIEALLGVTGHQQSLLISANPSRGRTIQHSRYFIDGIPLHETHFATDPHFPRHTSDVSSLLALTPSQDNQQNALPHIATPDVTTSADLAQLAKNCGPKTMPAGAADFFQALLDERIPSSRTTRQGVEHPKVTPPALLICGSRAAWRTRMQDCQSAGIPIHILGSPSNGFYPPHTAGLIGLGDDHHADSEQALRALATASTEIIKSFAVKTVLAEGGATAAALAQAKHWSQFTVVATSTGGVGVLQPTTPGAPRFLIKPGSYPWPTQIWQSFIRP